MLEGAPSLMAVTLLEELQRRHPERFADSVLRTLQRRVGQWRAEHGGEREIYFAQEHPPHPCLALHSCRSWKRGTSSWLQQVSAPTNFGPPVLALDVA